MLTHFNADDLLSLSTVERIRKCHELANESERLAETATADVREVYHDIAVQWRALAVEMRRAESAAA